MTEQLDTRQNTIDSHMMYRCACIAVMCGLSAYDWLTHSLYEPITTDRWNVSGGNLVFSLAYLSWDTWAMVGGVDRKILYRTDLLIHHLVSFVIFVYGLYFVPLIASHDLICESLSLLNYTMRGAHNESFLHKYRLATIFLIRFPISVGTPIFYYMNEYLLEPTSTTTGVSIRTYQIMLGFTHAFFTIYDLILVRKITGIMRKKRL
jgi:hypothetical protein